MSQLPTVTAPNYTFTDDTRDALLTRVVARLVAKGCTIENISCDGWEVVHYAASRGKAPFNRLWMIDVTIGSDEVRGVITITEAGRCGRTGYAKDAVSAGGQVGCYQAPGDDTREFRRLLGWNA